MKPHAQPLRGAAALAVACLSPAVVADTVFSDNFDTDTSVNWSVLWNANITLSAAPDYQLQWSYDYAAVGIPSAPGAGGTTRGLRIDVNDDATGAQIAVSLFPKNQNFTGAYSLKFDMWMNYPAAGNTTEHAWFGINTSGTRANRIVNDAGSDGVLFAITGEGGSSGTSTTARDYSVYFGNTAARPALQSALSLDNADAIPKATFPAAAHPYGFEGTPGMKWTAVEVKYEDDNVTLLLDGVPFSAFANTSEFKEGNIQIGYSDVFASASPADTFIVYDNVRVEIATVIPEPSTVALGLLGLGVLAFARRRA